jgi:hypothetical protein
MGNMNALVLNMCRPDLMPWRLFYNFKAINVLSLLLIKTQKRNRGNDTQSLSHPGIACNTRDSRGELTCQLCGLPTPSSHVSFPRVLSKYCLRRFYQDTLVQLVDALGWGVVVLADAKGMFPEDHPAFLGTYSPYYTSPVSVKQCYEAADAILFVGEQLLVVTTGGW